jgi:hypothetical protein
MKTTKNIHYAAVECEGNAHFDEISSISQANKQRLLIVTIFLSSNVIKVTNCVTQMTR